MLDACKTRKNRPLPSALARPGHERPFQSREMTCWQAFPGILQLPTVGPDLKANLFLRNEAGMSMKIKDRCGKLRGKAGMYMKKKDLVLKSV